MGASKRESRCGCISGGLPEDPGRRRRINYQLNEANGGEQTTATRTTHSVELVSNTSGRVVLAVDSSSSSVGYRVPVVGCGADRRVGRRQAKTGDRPSGDQQNRSGRTRNGDCKSLGFGGGGNRPELAAGSEAEAARTGRP